MFPDSGVPYTDARNSLANPITANCNPLWYSTSRCQPRFDPAAANAMLSELINLINKGEVTYDCNYFNQVEMAVRYLIQRGIPCGTALAGGPFNYVGALDPAATRYNDFMTLVVVPNVKNQGAVTLDINGRGSYPVLRNDGQQLRDGDWLPNTPIIISFWASAWRMVGLSASQVPLLLEGGVDLWIRTDGNDTTGDGSANTPDKAFRTIYGAWVKAAGRYAATPLFSINLKLGIPGTYVGAPLSGFGGRVTLSGDVSNIAAYRVSCFTFGSNIWGSLSISAIGSLQLIGITIQIDPTVSSVLAGSAGLYISNSHVELKMCNFELMKSVANMVVISVGSSASLSFNSEASSPGQFEFNGHGFHIESLVSGTANSTFGGSGPLFGGVLNIHDFTFDTTTYMLNTLSVITLENTIVNTSNTFGKKYQITNNSILAGNGQVAPGNVAGTADLGAQVSGVL
jgi:hypothetical protein